MTMRRMFIFAGILLVLFLAMYSWNRRTGILDDLAANVGLEISSTVLSPLRAVQDLAGDFWDRYLALVDVREENLRLKARVEELEAGLLAAGEDLAELRRLRELVQFPVDVRWRPLAARVLAGRMGPNAVLDTITISRGYATGARPGTPLVSKLGLVGRVLRASAHASTVLLITDPGSKVAVFGQETRAPGILKGHGTGKDMEVDFVQRDASLKNGEVLVTSGLDNKYPKGLPVARVTGVAPSDYTQFMAVEARPLVDLAHLEEVLLLEKSGVELPPEEPDAPPVLVGPPLPANLAAKRQAAASSASANGNGNAPSTSPTAGVSSAAPAAGQEGRRENAAQGANAANVPQNEPARRAVNQGARGVSQPSPKAPRYRIITP